MKKKVLLAGGSGCLGREILRILKQEGHLVRALSRRVDTFVALGLESDEVIQADLLDRGSLSGSCDGIDAVISCVGASLDPRRIRDRTGFSEVDFRGNGNLLSVAEAEAVDRFIYVSVFSTPDLSQTKYVEAHERFVELLRASHIEGVVVRPTGFFCMFGELLKMAKRNRGIVIGSGTSRTNPIHEADVAELCVGALYGQELDIPAGGPHVFTRQQMVELGFEVLKKTPRIHRVPPWVVRGIAAAIFPMNRRVAEVLRFMTVVSTVDVVAPRRGERELRTYLEELVDEQPP